jgi:hypothetical protein
VYGWFERHATVCTLSGDGRIALENQYRTWLPPSKQWLAAESAPYDASGTARTKRRIGACEVI